MEQFVNSIFIMFTSIVSTLLDHSCQLPYSTHVNHQLNILILNIVQGDEEMPRHEMKTRGGMP